MEDVKQDLLYRVARCLLDAPAKMAAAAALGLIGPAFDADRAWLIRLDAGLQNFWVADEWCGDGVPAFLPEMPCVPTSMIAHPLREFRRDRAVVLDDIEKLPPDAQMLKEEMRREGNRATAGVPLWRAGRLVALVGIDDVRKTHAWTATEMKELRRLGELVLTAADRSAEDAKTVDGAARGRSERPVSPRAEPGGCYLRAGNSHVQVGWDEVAAISARGDHSRVRLKGGRQFFELKALSVWEAMLPEERFLRVHRSHIVNWTQVESLQRVSGGRWGLRLRGGEGLPVGRSYQAAVRKRISLRGAGSAEKA